MNILSISTSSNVCSVAVLKDDICIKELSINDKKTHSEKLMPLIKELLDQLNLKLENIDLIACDIGPGSFTGIRIGIATIKAIAEPYNISIIGVTSLEALARNISNPTGIICSMIDARNGQVYCGFFNENYTLIDKYLADDINIIKKEFDKYKSIEFVGNGALENNIVTDTINNEISSINIGICAYNKFKNGIIENSDTILPMYLRKSQAERMKDIQNG